MVKNRITSLLHDITGIFCRFPISVCSIIIVTITSILYTLWGYKNNWGNQTFFSIIVGFIVLALLSYGVKLYSENNKFPKSKNVYLLYSLSILYSLFSGIFCFYNHNNPFIDYYLFIFPIAALLIIIVLPFYGKNSPDTLWNYIIKLSSSIIISLIYSITTLIGLVLICMAIDSLFGSHIFNPELLLIIIFVFFAPCMILAFTPTNFNEYNTEPSYSIIFKILIKYILFILILIYGSVLYAYAIKILITWSLPKGIVTYMIIFFAIFGTILWYLLYPNTKNKSNSLHTFYRKYFYHLLVPLLALLFIALLRRTGEYGLTTNRYIVILIGIWFTIISFCAILKRINNIIPFITTSALLILLFSFGPWSIFELPKTCQFRDFEKYAAQQGLLKEEKLIKSENSLSKEQNIILSGYLDFFIPNYKEEFENIFYKEDTDSLFIRSDYTQSEINQKIMSQLNGKYYSSYKRLDIKYGLEFPDEQVETISLFSTNNIIKEIQQYTYFFQYNGDDNTKDTLSISFENYKFKIIKDSLTNISFIYPNIDTLSINFSQTAANIYNKLTSSSYHITLPPEDSYITLTGKRLNIIIGLQHISVPVNINNTGDAYLISNSTYSEENYRGNKYELNCFFYIK